MITASLVILLLVLIVLMHEHRLVPAMLSILHLLLLSLSRTRNGIARRRQITRLRLLPRMVLPRLLPLLPDVHNHRLIIVLPAVFGSVRLRLLEAVRVRQCIHIIHVRVQRTRIEQIARQISVNDHRRQIRLLLRFARSRALSRMRLIALLIAALKLCAALKLTLTVRRRHRL